MLPLGVVNESGARACGGSSVGRRSMQGEIATAHVAVQHHLLNVVSESIGEQTHEHALA